VGPARRVYERVAAEAYARSYRASGAIRNAALHVLRGQRSGRTYRVPFTRRRYTASAPGEPPALRTGALRGSWLPRPRSERTPDATRVYPGVHTVVPYARFLQEGTPRIRPRPYVGPVLEKAWPQIRRIYREPYLGG